MEEDQIEENPHLDWSFSTATDAYCKLKDEDSKKKMIQSILTAILQDTARDSQKIGDWLDWCAGISSLENQRDNAFADQPHQYLQDLVRDLPKKMCAYEFKPGDIAWNCKSCQVDDTCVLCNECFINSQHEGHEVFFYYTHNGGCCDCGDTEAWDPSGFCTNHRVCFTPIVLLLYDSPYCLGRQGL